MNSDTFSVSPAVLTLVTILLVRVDGLFIGNRHQYNVGSRLEALERKFDNYIASPSAGRIRRRAKNPSKKAFWGGSRIFLGGDGLKMLRTKEVGFHSAHTETKQYKPGDTIKFDHVITNLGNAYTPGKFTCPENGTYLFNLNILADAGSYIEVAIKMNETPVFKAISYNRRGDTYNQGGGSAIVKLKVGDVITVKMVEPKDGGETLLGGFSHFSGYLMKP